jgi:2-methylisocitrate lyase-like PEP mutase family enzyme
MSLADTFRTLHHQPTPLLLPNAWDAGSAALMQSLGAAAVATSSAALCWAEGYADGDHLPMARLVAATARIARVLRVPLTVDAEVGYSSEPAEVAEHIARLIDAGAVGINIEDGRAKPELLARKIEAIRHASERAGVALFINARCDVYLKGLAPEGERAGEMLRRAALYEAAGADGLFAAGARHPGEIAEICAGTRLPVNLLAMPGVPAAAELAALGVKRISSGSGPAEWLYGQLGTLMQGFLADGSGERFAPGARGWAAMNSLIAGG